MVGHLLRYPKQHREQPSQIIIISVGSLHIRWSPKESMGSLDYNAFRSSDTKMLLLPIQRAWTTNKENHPFSF